MRNPTLVFFDTSYGYAPFASKEADRDLTEKELRKWWRHYADNLPENLTVVATYETLDGEIKDITQDWVCHECAKYTDAHYN